MVKGPDLFKDLGKKARDLLYKDYSYDHKFSFSTQTASGLVLTSNASATDETFLGDVTTQFKTEKLTTDLKIDTSSNVITTMTLEEPVAGLKGILNFSIPDEKSRKVELQYKNGYAAITTAVGITLAPLTEFSAVFGSGDIALGSEIGFDTADSSFTKYNVGFAVVKPDFSTSFFLTDKADTIKYSYIHTLNQDTKFSLAAEMAYSLSKKESKYTLGALCVLDPLTIMKGRLSHDGKYAALLQHEWRPKSLVTISGEVDTDKKTKVGVSITMKP